MTTPTSPPISYTPRPTPSLGGSDQTYYQRELRNLKASLDSIIRLMPQVATVAPTTLVDGMVRLSRSPWRPVVAQTLDAWVFYDAPSATWKYCRLN